MSGRPPSGHVPGLLLAVLLAGCGEPGPAETPAGPGPVASADREAILPRFPDRAAASGIDFVHTHGGSGTKYLFETMGSGVAATDFDGDGLPDLLFLQSGTLPPEEFTPQERQEAVFETGTTARLYRNLGSFRFEDVTEGSGLDVPFYAQGLAVGDVDGDGDRDVYAAAYGRSRLFLNDGRARFREAGLESGLSDELWTICGAFFDVEGDGDLDLYTVSYLDMPLHAHAFCGPSRRLRAYCHVDLWEGADDRLYLNDGQGRLTDASENASLSGTRGKGLASIAADFDQDGDIDIFVANDSQPNLLFRNEGDGRLTDVARRSGVDLNAEGRSEACMGTDAGDLDGDGDLDLYIANFEQETNTLYRNDGQLFFTDVSVTSGAGVGSLAELGFGVVFLDVENDGDLDVYVANGHILDNVEEIQQNSMYAQPDQLYLNDGRGRFSLAPPELGPSLSERRVGRSVARADLDRDGDEDLVVGNSNEPPWVLRNDLAQAHRIALRLQGPDGRADAEGVRVVARSGERSITRVIVGGAGYAAHADTEIIVGLGDATRVDALEIHWPFGPTSEHGPLDADRRYTFAYGGELLRSEELAAPSQPGDP